MFPSMGRQGASAAPATPDTPHPYPPQANAATNPRVTRTSTRPEASAGLDGWLVDRLFGGRH
jgi:penicillin-binding protein 1A